MTHWNTKHGYAKPGLRDGAYRSWECMKSRCNNPNDPSFLDYGARGITVFDLWAKSFQTFLTDMGPRPLGTSLDRIDVDKGYEPGNCRWATPKIQARNKRSNRMVEWCGARITLVELGELTGVPYQRLHDRIVRRGWDVERAVNEPVRVWP